LFFEYLVSKLDEKRVPDYLKEGEFEFERALYTDGDVRKDKECGMGVIGVF
jgi:hypothetical protein